MASAEQVVEELLNEAGKSSAVARREFSRAVGDVTVEILEASDARFRRLSRSTVITVNTTETEYKLPFDFRTAKKRMIQVDAASNGNFIARAEIVSENRFYELKGDSNYGGLHWAMIESRAEHPTAPGEYLVFNAAFTETTYYKFFYYRIPSPRDTDVIKKISAVKAGARGALPNYFDNSDIEQGKYLRMLGGIVESPETTTTGMSMKPNKAQQAHNRLMKNIGRGQ